MKKRMLAALLGAAMMTPAAFAAVPANQTPAAAVDAPAAAETKAMAEMVSEKAKVLEVIKENDKIASLLVSTPNQQELVLHVADSTLVMDTQTGFIASLEALKKDDEVFVYYSNRMTMSLPPQVQAYAVLVNLDENHAPASLLTAEKITRNADGSLVVEAQEGGILVTLPAQIDIRPLATRNIVTLSDIHVGTRFFAWYDVVAASMPGRATATKAVLPPQADKSLTIVQGDIALGEAQVTDGVVMVPVRKTAEAMGYTVTWDAAARSFHLKNDKMQTTVVIGEDLYAVSTAKEGMDGMTKPVSLGAAAYIKNNVSFMPAELLQLLGETVELRGSVLWLGGAQSIAVIEPELPNPIEEKQSPKDLAAIGLGIDAPKGAEDVSYAIIAGDLAQVEFRYRGKPYTFRACKSTEDISGVWMDYARTETFSVDGTMLTVKTIAHDGGFAAGWTRDGVQYSLTMLEKGDAAAFTEMAKMMAA